MSSPDPDRDEYVVVSPHPEHPDWGTAKPDRQMEWRNYINADLREIWETFTAHQRWIIAMNAQELANRDYEDVTLPPPSTH